MTADGPLCPILVPVSNTLQGMLRSTEEGRLDSWKAIARFLGRSVRTVRRWEQQEGLPVHRQMHQSKASVYAFRHELDDWRASRSQAPSDPAPPDSGTLAYSAPDTTASAAPSKEAAAIAVLPFSFAGPDPSQAWVADGLTEEMISGFSRLASLRVTSKTSSGTFKNTDQDSGTIAARLGVNHLLEGGVTGDGRRLRINVRLINPHRDEQVWSRTFSGEMEDVFDIHEQIARAVVDALELELEPREEVAIGRPMIDNLSAWRRVILARATAFQWHPEALERARTLLIEALELTGDNAPICATMGRVLIHHLEAGISDREGVLKEARVWENRARAADANHPETLILSGWLAHVSGDLQRAIVELESALEADHDHPDALMLLAHCLLRVGLLDRVRPVIEHAMAVDPLTPVNRCFPGYIAAMEGRFEHALEPYSDMLKRDPTNPVARLFNVWIHFAAGQNHEALAIAEGFAGPAQNSTPAHVARLFVFAHLGTIEECVMPEEVREAARSSEMFSRLTSEAWALAGNAAVSAQWLERAVKLGFIKWPYLAQHSPMLVPMADDPALAPVLAEARERWLKIKDAMACRVE
jgi:TolB-like protein